MPDTANTPTGKPPRQTLYIAASPEDYNRAPPDRIQPEAVLNERLQAAYDADGRFRTDLQMSLDYYEGTQTYPPEEMEEANPGFKVVVNLVRRDADLQLATALDSRHVIVPQGRYPRNRRLGKTVRQLVEWVRQEDIYYEGNCEDALQDAVQAGEGAIWTFFDPYAEDNEGMVVTEWLDPRWVYFPLSARDFQHQKGDWLIIAPPVSVARLQARYGDKLDGAEIESDFPNFYEEQHLAIDIGAEMSGRDDPGASFGARSTFEQQNPQAMQRIMYEKWVEYEKKRRKKVEGKAVVLPEGEWKEQMKVQSEAEKESWESIYTENITLYETIVINNTCVVGPQVSKMDRSRGGHGLYPVSFFIHTRLRREAKGRGFIIFNVGLQDMTNRMAEQYLLQMFIANLGFFYGEQGGLEEQEVEQLMNGVRLPFPYIEGRPGYRPPAWVGANPSGATLAGSGMQLLQQFYDRTSGVNNEQRGTARYSGESGRLVRARLAQNDLFHVTPRRHFESGFQSLTVQQAHLTVQHLRGRRLASIVDPVTDEEKPLFIGQSLEEILAHPDWGLRVDHPQTKARKTDDNGFPVVYTADGEEAEILILDDTLLDALFFKRLKLKLEMGHERKQLERDERTELIVQMVGAAALEWACEEWGIENREKLIDAVNKRDELAQFKMQLEEISKQSGVPVEKLMQALWRALERLATEAAGMPAPGGNGQPGQPARPAARPEPVVEGAQPVAPGPAPPTPPPAPAPPPPPAP